MNNLEVYTSSHHLSDALRPRVANQLISRDPKDFHSSLRSARLGENCYLSLEEHRELSGMIQPKTDTYFTFPQVESRMFCNGQEMNFTKNPLAFQVYQCSEMSDFSYQTPLSLYGLYVNQAHLVRVFETLTREDGDVLLKLKSAQFSSAAARSKILKQLQGALVDSQEDQCAESSILESFIESIDLKRPSEPISYCNRIAQKAHEIIIATPGRRVSLTEVCEELNVASRSLQKGFTDVYGMGFTEYHQLYRLHKLRAYLRKNGGKSGDLINIIGFYGFHHAGRLSKYYKDAFGVLPSKESKLKPSEVHPLFAPG